MPDAEISRAPGADRLEAISPALRHLPAGELVWRVHFLGGEHPCSWRQWRTFILTERGPTSSRFDHQLPDVKGLPQAQNRKILSINSGPRARARRWAQQFYQAYSRLDGILYPSSMYANSPAVAFFERAEDCVPAKPSFHRMLADPALEDALANIASDIGYGLSGPGV